jgi:hypothetical protein
MGAMTPNQANSMSLTSWLVKPNDVNLQKSNLHLIASLYAIKQSIHKYVTT